MQDRAEAIRKAQQFADTAYAAEVESITRRFQEKLGEFRAQSAARGSLRSGGAVAETAKINAERITALLQARLDFFLEGFELCDVLIDEQVTTHVISAVLGLRSTKRSTGTGERSRNARLA